MFLAICAERENEVDFAASCVATLLSSPTISKPTHDWTPPPLSPANTDVTSAIWLPEVKPQEEPEDLSVTSQPVSYVQFPMPGKLASTVALYKLNRKRQATSKATLGL